jgi:hypothetical protein
VAAGCGATKHPLDATADNNGFYVTLDGLHYQLQVSRELNRFATEDHQYLAGLPTGVAAPAQGQIWYGVFLRAVNTTKTPLQTSDTFDIIDTEGNKYYPVALNPSVNQYAWTARTLPPLGTEPAPDTTAFFGPTQGSLVLFKLSTTVYSNRPLTLEIHGAGSRPASISLDL